MNSCVTLSIPKYLSVQAFTFISRGCREIWSKEKKRRYRFNRSQYSSIIPLVAQRKIIYIFVLVRGERKKSGVRGGVGIFFVFRVCDAYPITVC